MESRDFKFIRIYWFETNDVSTPLSRLMRVLVKTLFKRLVKDISYATNNKCIDVYGIVFFDSFGKVSLKALEATRFLLVSNQEKIVGGPFNIHEKENHFIFNQSRPFQAEDP